MYLPTSRRSTIDNSMNELKKPTQTDYKTSSLPRGATTSPISTPVISSSLPRGSKINTLTTKEQTTLLESPG